MPLPPKNWSTSKRSGDASYEPVPPIVIEISPDIARDTLRAANLPTDPQIVRAVADRITNTGNFALEEYRKVCNQPLSATDKLKALESIASNLRRLVESPSRAANRIRRLATLLPYYSKTPFDKTLVQAAYRQGLKEAGAAKSWLSEFRRKLHEARTAGVTIPDNELRFALSVADDAAALARARQGVKASRIEDRKQNIAPRNIENAVSRVIILNAVDFLCENFPDRYPAFPRVDLDTQVYGPKKLQSDAPEPPDFLQFIAHWFYAIRKSLSDNLIDPDHAHPFAMNYDISLRLREGILGPSDNAISKRYTRILFPAQHGKKKKKEGIPVLAPRGFLRD